MNENKVVKGNFRPEIFNTVNENVRALGVLFPEVVKDGQVDFEALKEELGQFEEIKEEKYGLTWAGKQKAKKISQEDIMEKTLKIKDIESKGVKSTQNLYIEGNNLDVLRLLRHNYYGGIKMIYIDPPYNTGKDFIYKDKDIMDTIKSEMLEGAVDEDGERNIINQKSSNKYHANWLSMIYSRLIVAKDLLTSDGIIFISIDDSEIDNLRKVCNEVFGESNFIAQLIWQNKKGGGNDSKHIAIEHEYIVVYSKQKEAVEVFYETYSEKYLERYKEEDEIGKYYWDTFKRKSGKQYYPIVCPDGTVLEVDEDGNPISWLRSQARFFKDVEIGDIRFVKKDEGWSVQFKQRLPQGKTPRSIFSTESVLTQQGTTSAGSEDIYKYFKKDIFSNPKPVELIKYIIGFGLNDGETILDFFSGSATTAEAVMQSNREDGGNRKYILVQLQEDIDKMLANSSVKDRLILENAVSVLDEIDKKHYITELGKERIRRASEKILSEIKDETERTKIDVGFKVFEVGDTNIRWNYEDIQAQKVTLLQQETQLQIAATQQMANTQLDIASMMSDKDKLDFMPGFTDIDVVYELLLRQRDIPLSAKVEQLKEAGERTYLFAQSYLVCLETEITTELVEKIAALQPLPIKFIFRDSAFEDDINLKDETIRRFKAFVARNKGEKQSAYTVEFI